VTRVDFYADGALVGTASVEPYRVRWNTRKSSGAVTLVAVAWDAAGNSAASNPVTVTVANSSSGKPVKQR
jgi:predicted RecA/RadA family phage recombinase